MVRLGLDGNSVGSIVSVGEEELLWNACSYMEPLRGKEEWMTNTLALLSHSCCTM